MEYLLMRNFLCIVACFAAACSAAADEPWTPGIAKPAGMVSYKPAKKAQLLFNQDQMRAVPRSQAAAKYHQPGGLADATGWKSTLYAWFPSARKEWSIIPVWNGGYVHWGSIDGPIVMNADGTPKKSIQAESGYVQKYAVGARFDDVLTYRGHIFEHRSWFKDEDGWTPEVLYRDPSARPPGYKRVTRKECRECHRLAGGAGGASGDGLYNKGLPPGSDNIFSYPVVD
jgi:hypothetical protein